MRVLGIETSCDETAAAVVAGDDPQGPVIVSNVIHSQVTRHAVFGGVVPEIASREHVVNIDRVVEAAVNAAGGYAHLDGLAVTSGPGLLGALLVGLQFTKGLALALSKPWIAVNHLEGHLAAAFLGEEKPTYPHVALLVSGGHSELYDVRAFGEYVFLGGTRDDAAGEAFDKIGKVLGLAYPAGRQIEELAQGGDARAVQLPQGLPKGATLDFSFSGLKTFAVRYLRERQRALLGQERADFCASLQEAIANVLTKQAVAAALKVGAPGVVLAGGVAANTRLRQLLAERCAKAGLWAFVPRKHLCTDNAAMIAAAGWVRLRRGEKSGWQENARSRWGLGE